MAVAAQRVLEAADGSRLVASLALFGRAFLSGYSQIFLSRSLVVGALLVAVTAVSARMLVMGAAAVALAILLAQLVGLSTDLIRSGLYSYNALLIGLGGAAMFEASDRATLLIGLAVVVSVLVTAAMHSALWYTFNLPVLTLPFLFSFVLLLGAASTMKLGPAPALEWPWGELGLRLPLAVKKYLESLGAIFFAPRVDAGLVALLALVVFSRIGTLLSLVGFAMAFGLASHLNMVNDPRLPLIAGYNFMLTAIALGGVWFVPSISSLLLAVVGTGFCGLVTLGLSPYLSWNGIPLLIGPFNVTVILALYAMRQRIRDHRPKSVDFFLGSPEENLSFFRTRLARFGSQYAARLRAPFRGKWICTQGVEGELTHRGLWRDAFDFEVTGADGELCRGRGKRLEDYHCYRLPVLAAADGTVVKVVGHVPDNPIGEVNLIENWGNLVIVRHAPGLHSVVAHLASGSTKVVEGQTVRSGDVLGACGSSGRSDRPHLHFQLQATDQVGAPTLAVELHDVIEVSDKRETLHGRMVVERDQVIRNIEPQREVAGLLALRFGETMTFRVMDRYGERIERIQPEIDLTGNVLLRSRDTSAVLYLSPERSMLTVYDTLGSGKSMLHLLHAALARVPFEVGKSLQWTDVLPSRRALSRVLAPLLDPIAMFVPGQGLEMQYRAEWQGSALHVLGKSSRQGRDHEPLVATRAILRAKVGIEAIEIVERGRVDSAKRLDNASAEEPSQ